MFLQALGFSPEKESQLLPLSTSGAPPRLTLLWKFQGGGFTPRKSEQR